MKELSDKDLRELRRIQDSIPAEYKKRLLQKRKVTPTMEKVLNMALKEDLDPKQRERLQNVKDSGILSQKEEVTNRAIERKVDQYVTAEILKSIRAGRLSKPEPGTALYKYFKHER